MRKEEEQKKSSGLSPTTKTRLANLFNRLPKLGRERKDSDQETGGGRRRKDQVSQSSPLSANTNPSAGQESVCRALPPTGSATTRRSTPSTERSLSRTRSASSDNGFNRNGQERNSYRAPRGTSRYLQVSQEKEADRLGPI